VTAMVVPGLLPAAPRGVEWDAGATTVRLMVTDPAALVPAHRIVERRLDAVQRAWDRRRPDAEMHKVDRAGGRPVRVTPLLAELVGAALAAAARTDGDVDPTAARTMTAALGYLRDLSALPVCGAGIGSRGVPRWRRIRLRGRRLAVPPGTILDLADVARRFAADRCAAEVAQRLGTGVLVGLDHDVATAGPAPDGGWRVPLGEEPRDPDVALPTGAGLATAHHPGRPAEAMIRPRPRGPAEAVWRTVSVLAFTCQEAGTYSAAAMVRGTSAAAWLRSLGVPARLVTLAGDVIIVGAWPGPDDSQAQAPPRRYSSSRQNGRAG